MEGISEKLGEILNDKDSMEKIKAMAEDLLSGDSERSDTSGLSYADIEKITTVFARLKNSSSGREKLLMALRPYLSEKRQGKIDSAVKIVKIIEILPYLKDSGILDGW